MSEKRQLHKTSSRKGRGRETKTIKARKSKAKNARIQKEAVVKLFLADPTEQTASDLLACFDDRESVQTWIVDNAADLMDSHLHCLANAGFDLGADLEDGRNLLHVFATNPCKSMAKNVKRLKFICDCGADIEQETCGYSTPLLEALFDGDLLGAMALLKIGADINNAGYCGYRSPLMLALDYIDSSVLDKFISLGADVNYKASDGESAVSLAVHDFHALERLFEAGADVNWHNNRGEGLVHRFIAGWNIKEQGKDENGDTLFFAAPSDWGLKELIYSGAQIDAIDNKGLTPLESRIERCEKWFLGESDMHQGQRIRVMKNALKSIEDCAVMLKRFGAKAECVMQLASGPEGVLAYFSSNENRFPLLASYVKSLGNTFA